jgi:hypothetical protein
VMWSRSKSQGLDLDPQGQDQGQGHNREVRGQGLTKFGLEAPRDQGQASRTTSPIIAFIQRHVSLVAETSPKFDSMRVIMIIKSHCKVPNNFYTNTL